MPTWFEQIEELVSMIIHSGDCFDRSRSAVDRECLCDALRFGPGNHQNQKDILAVGMTTSASQRLGITGDHDALIVESLGHECTRSSYVDYPVLKA